jgi:N-methylhydantoinase B
MAGAHAAGQLRDPVLTPVLASRVDAIVREMSNTLLRSARSNVIAAAKDFSCAILTHDDQLIAAAESLPVHILGSHLQTRAMRDLHPDLAEGDAFLHNDPYLGNSHAADHALLVPVFVDGEHMFTAFAKAHQADIGNSVPTTYHAFARDVYEEGALIFPCVRVQRDGETIADIVRMCERRIRVPEQWRGDFLALIGAARIGERRLKELCASYGAATIKAFLSDWLDYAEQRMVRAIQRLPAASIVSESAHDPVEPILPDGIPVKVEIEVDPIAAKITVDLRDNIDCVDCGLNQTEACCLANVFTAIFNCLPDEVPHNAGAFRRVDVLLRDGCVVGRPSFPHSCSVSTTNVAERLIYAIHSGFAQLGEGHGLAEAAASMGGAMAVISGEDARHGDAPYVNQLFIGVGGGPASAQCDGWLTFCMPTAAGMIHLDSIELSEGRYPIKIDSARVLPGTGGSGCFRGAPAIEVIYGPTHGPVTAIIPSDGHYAVLKGVRGGDDAHLGATYKIAQDGGETKLPNVVTVNLTLGERLRAVEGGGAGYGAPLARAPERVLHDVREEWETPERARDIYGVVLSDSGGALAVDENATQRQRAILMSQNASQD